MKVVEIFQSIQGEGPEIGTPTLFIRLAGCNSKCKFCDTKYSWKGGKEYSINQIIDKIVKSGMYHITWTGGEPTLQIKEIREVIRILGFEYKHSIETNGSLIHDMLPEFNCIVVSPKFDTLKEAFVPGGAYIKCVCRDKKDVKKWLDIINQMNLNKSRCYFMPEGTTDKELRKKSLWLIEECKKNNIKFSPRLQVWLWKKRRGK